MTREHVLNTLNQLEYGDGIPKDVSEFCRENNLLIVYGVSDDLTELSGVINEEFGLGDIIIRKEGETLLLPTDLDDFYGFDGVYKTFKTIGAIGVDEKGDLTGYITPFYGRDGFTFETDLPHETFVIKEDGEVQCIGLLVTIS